MLVDSERVLAEVKALIAAKPSHGARDLLAEIGRLEARYRVAPDEMEMFVRKFAHHFYDSFLGLMPGDHEDTDPLTRAAGSALAMVGTPHLRSHHQDSEESPSWNQTQVGSQ